MTTGHIPIPPAVVEAAARAMWPSSEPPTAWERTMAHIALRAGLKAWPNADWSWGDMLILPLTENSNGK